jgi:hypothetical protein
MPDSLHFHFGVNQVSAGTTVFQARGKVIYSDPNTGSGVESRYQAVLEEWLLEAKDINRLTER